MRWLHKSWIFARYLVAWVYTLVISVCSCLLCILIGPSRMWTLMARPWGRGTLFLLGVKLQIEGAENLRGPAVFVSNHQSLIDVVFMPAILPKTVRFVAKRELLLIPFWGWAFAAGGAVLIDRSRPRQAIEAMRRGLRRLPQGWSLIVFPEGTRSKDGQLRQFKKGAFHLAVETRMPVVPVGMEGARDIVPPDGWLVHGGTVQVTVGQPISTAAWSFDSIDAHVAEGRAAVQACVDLCRARRRDLKGAAFGAETARPN